jgi:hypothetical protein
MLLNSHSLGIDLKYEDNVTFFPPVKLSRKKGENSLESTLFLPLYNNNNEPTP